MDSNYRRQRRLRPHRVGATVETADPGTLADIDTVARSVGVPGWDVALVGDGAGRNWDKAAGWSTILIDRHTRWVLGGAGGVPIETEARAHFSGGMNRGTCEIAELMAYVHGLSWYADCHGRPRRQQLSKPVLDVLVITDRQSIVCQWARIAAGQASQVRRRQPLWAALIEIERQGFRYHWVWKARGKLALNSLADRLADMAKHAAADALALATAHVHTDLPEQPSDEDLIYYFNAAAFDAGPDVKPIRRKNYGKKTQSGGAGV